MYREVIFSEYLPIRRLNYSSNSLTRKSKLIKRGKKNEQKSLPDSKSWSWFQQWLWHTDRFFFKHLAPNSIALTAYRRVSGKILTDIDVAGRELIAPSYTTFENRPICHLSSQKEISLHVSSSWSDKEVQSMGMFIKSRHVLFTILNSNDWLYFTI